ncbi:MAG TPA: UPF0175 family protein [archaeon]|nr:UPF0175 family protein [archaeon]HLD80505.1 UPF0175 family protein [archaeon]
MNHAIGIRLPEQVLMEIDKLSKEELEDRSTIIRKLVVKGMRDLAKEKAAQQYIEGKTTISGAAHAAGLTVWEMEQYLVSKGFKSDYSVEDLQKGLKALGEYEKKRKK